MFLYSSFTVDVLTSSILLCSQIITRIDVSLNHCSYSCLVSEYVWMIMSIYAYIHDIVAIKQLRVGLELLVSWPHMIATIKCLYDDDSIQLCHHFILE